MKGKMDTKLIYKKQINELQVKLADERRRNSMLKAIIKSKDYYLDKIANEIWQMKSAKVKK